MLETLIFAAGIGQLIPVVGSLAIPQVLNWRKDTSKLRPLRDESGPHCGFCCRCRFFFIVRFWKAASGR